MLSALLDLLAFVHNNLTNSNGRGMLSIGLIDYIKVHSKICGMCKKDLAEEIQNAASRKLTRRRNTVQRKEKDYFIATPQ